MSYKELAKNLIDQIPETIASMKELESGGGTVFTGSTEALFAELMEE